MPTSSNTPQAPTLPPRQMSSAHSLDADTSYSATRLVDKLSDMIQRRPLPHQAEPAADIQFSPDGKHLATARSVA
jgi:hypothetical protein